MSDEHASTPDPELTEIAASLGSLVPSKARIDRDRIMYRAGQLSVRRPSTAHRTWFAVAAGLMLVASAEGVLLARRPRPEVVERVVIVREPAGVQDVPSVRPAPEKVPASVVEIGPSSQDRLADQVFRYGLDGLPRSLAISSGVADPQASSRRQMQQEMLKDFLVGDPS